MFFSSPEGVCILTAVKRHSHHLVFKGVGYQYDITVELNLAYPTAMVFVWLELFFKQSTELWR